MGGCDDEGVCVLEWLSSGDRVKLNLVDALFPKAAATVPVTIGDMAICFPVALARDGGLNEKSSSFMAIFNFFCGSGC